MCADCHAAVADRLKTDRFVHGPMNLGDCRLCHAVHASAEPSLLVRPATALCTDCHSEALPPAGTPAALQPHPIMDASRSLCTQCHDFRADAVFTHSFVAEGRCFLCHSFHEAPLSGDVASLCLGCHRENPRLPEAHHGVAFERSRCTNCHLPHQARRGKLLRAVEHTPFEARSCEECHRDRAAKIGPVFGPLCTDCHRDKDAAAESAAVTVHPPFSEDDCSSCHRSHNAEAANILREPQGSLCLGCHRKMRKAMLIAPVSSHSALVRSPGGDPWAVGHKPVAEGRCRLCHRSHTSGNAKLMKSPQAQTCRPCHGEFFAEVEGGGMKSLHRPVKEGECAVCHDLHGGVRARLLKDGARAAVCRVCHPNPSGAHHQFSVAQLKEAGNESKVETSGCLHCHLPHASSQRRLLLPTSDEVCQGCHKN